MTSDFAGPKRNLRRVTPEHEVPETNRSTARLHQRPVLQTKQEETQDPCQRSG